MERRIGITALGVFGAVIWTKSPEIEHPSVEEEWSPLQCGCGMEESGLSYTAVEVVVSFTPTVSRGMITRYCFFHLPCVH
jgi:hypothetical protein